MGRKLEIWVWKIFFKCPFLPLFIIAFMTSTHNVQNFSIKSVFWQNTYITSKSLWDRYINKISELFTTHSFTNFTLRYQRSCVPYLRSWLYTTNILKISYSTCSWTFRKICLYVLWLQNGHTQASRCSCQCRTYQSNQVFVWRM